MSEEIRRLVAQVAREQAPIKEVLGEIFSYYDERDIIEWLVARDQGRSGSYSVDIPDYEKQVHVQRVEVSYTGFGTTSQPTGKATDVVLNYWRPIDG